MLSITQTGILVRACREPLVGVRIHGSGQVAAAERLADLGFGTLVNVRGRHFIASTAGKLHLRQFLEALETLDAPPVAVPLSNTRAVSAVWEAHTKNAEKKRGKHG